MKRTDIKLGYSCNNNCLFCRVSDSRTKTSDSPTDEILGILNSCREKGVEKILFTGGEPTIRKDIVGIVAYAKKLGFRTVCLETNGRLLKYEDYARNLIESGVDMFSVSFHAHNERLGDYLSQSRGSFNQTKTGIKNLKKLGAVVHTNTVIVKPNYRYLPRITRLLISLEVDHMNFPFLNPLGNALDNKDEIVPRISDVEKYLHRSIDICDENSTPVTAEAVPYCFMKGYEKKVAEDYMPLDFDIVAPDFKVNFRERKKRGGKVKFEKCRGCMHFEKCEGIWSMYAKLMGEEEFKPVKG